MSLAGRGRPWPRAARGLFVLALPLLLVLLQGLFWKLQVFDAPGHSGLVWRNVDLFTEHVPNMSYAARTLREGRLPLWNPYQLCGVPFLALPLTGVFYPPNAV